MESICRFVGKEVTEFADRLTGQDSTEDCSTVAFFLQDVNDEHCWFVELGDRGLVLGRSRGADLVLVDTTVSGQHAKISRDSGQLYLRDLASTNGSFINGERIQTQRLGDGDILRLGGVRLRVVLSGVPETSGSNEVKPDPAQIPPSTDEFLKLLRPTGVLADLAGDGLAKRIREAGRSKFRFVLVSFNEVHSASHDALQGLVELRRELVSLASELILCSINQTVRDNLVATRLEAELADIIFPDEAAARQFVSRCQSRSGSATSTVLGVETVRR
jgi:anti-anti-sigma regulatory factor